MTEQYYIMPHVELAELRSYEIIGTLGALAKGSLGQEISDQAAVETLREAAAMRVPVNSTRPATCMDGRPVTGMLPYDGTRDTASLRTVAVRNKMAGGTGVSGFLGNDLTRTYRRRYPVEVDPAIDVVEDRFTPWARANKNRLGIHVSDRAHAPGCGCGMCDGAPKVAELILQDEYAENKAGLLVPVVTKLMRGPFRDEVHAAALADTYEFWVQTAGSAASPARWTGARVIEAVRSVSDPDAFERNTEVTTGAHKEELGVVAYEDSTLHRDAFVGTFGKQVFWVDEPAILREAHRQSINPHDIDEVHARYQVMMTANVAGAATLVNEGLKFATIGQKPSFNI